MFPLSFLLIHIHASAETVSIVMVPQKYPDFPKSSICLRDRRKICNKQ